MHTQNKKTKINRKALSLAMALTALFSAGIAFATTTLPKVTIECRSGGSECRTCIDNVCGPWEAQVHAK